jgi:dTDP-4-dehydrorhamnose 3,5-epimerase/CDP-3, 6-dideoxy-D-glycero-D-glycero-4-hexulose-5-epimerase
MIEKKATPINDLFILSNSIFHDMRGSFRKIFSCDAFKGLFPEEDIAELYYSVNKKDVIRGMHFQIPPVDHIKLIYVISGNILDVCLDLRSKSRSFGKFFSLVLSGDDASYLYIPKGIAHGFASLEDNTVVHYAQTSCYSPKHDFGIKYDSFGFNWPIKNPIVSDRDQTFPNLVDWNTVF